MAEKSEDLFTDVVLELLTAYLLSSEREGKDLTMQVMESVRNDPHFGKAGFMEGMLFSAILHLSLMTSYMSLLTGEHYEDILKRYALTYQLTKETIARMPQVHPEFVAKMADKFGGLY